MRRAPALAVVLVAACGSRGPGLDRERAAAVFTRVAVDTGGVHGLSGLAVDRDGRLWTVAERGAAAFAITLDGGVAITRRHPIVGLPAGEDLEAVAVADGGGLWLGTEGRDRGVARVFHAARAGDGFAIDRPAIELRADAVGVDLGANHGAEGVCAAGGQIFVAIETAGRDGDGRWAPVVAIDPVTGEQRVRRLRLTSDTGKLAALDCWRDGDRVRGWAIERHFAVTRVLAFDLDGEGAIAPTVLVDLGPVLRGSLNLEGLARLPDGRPVAAVDNQYRTITGPDEVLVFRAAP